jgi:hypothetical protein
VCMSVGRDDITHHARHVHDVSLPAWE